jgi:hypothetical protein
VLPLSVLPTPPFPSSPPPPPPQLDSKIRAPTKSPAITWDDGKDSPLFSTPIPTVTDPVLAQIMAVSSRFEFLHQF